jgi:hypothetical protein
MKWARAALLAAAMAVPSGGCGTARNLASGEPDNYGGVQRDLQFAAEAGAGGGLLAGADSAPAGESGKYSGGGVLAFAFLGLYAADLSLCCVGDTLTLPLVMYLRQRREDASAGRAVPAGPSGGPRPAQE